MCRPCQSHLNQSGGVFADTVVPISYSPRSSQHHHNLRTYKDAMTSSGQAHTWTTGARAQSLAHALKTSGADTVATVALGRHVGVGSDYAPAKRLLAAIASPVFDTTRCIYDESSRTDSET